MRQFGLLVILLLVVTPAFVLGAPSLFCGTTVDDVSDPLLTTLRTSPKTLRSELFDAAKANRYDLTRVAFPYTGPHSKWMADQLNRPTLAGAVRFLSANFFLGLTPQHREFLAAVHTRLTEMAERPDSISYAEFLYMSGLYAKGRELIYNPTSVHLPRNVELPIELKRLPLDWFRISYERLMEPGAKVLVRYPEQTDLSFELSESALIPLRQDFIDDYLFQNDEFLLLIAYHLYPIGLSVGRAYVHGESVAPERFGAHDISHASLNYRAWKLLLARAQDESLPNVLKNYYQMTAPHTEKVAEDLVAAMAAIEDPILRNSARVVAWDVFHENEVAFNPLDAWAILTFSQQGRAIRALHSVKSQYGFQAYHGSRFRSRPGIDWLINYFESKLPAAERSELISAITADHYERGILLKPGAIRYPIGH